MINRIIRKTIKNIPRGTNPINMDLVLDGGMFNGSYLIGSLYFLKELERIKYVNIKRISGTSVGAAVALLYLINKLDLSQNISKKIKEELQKTYFISIIKNYKNLIFENKELKEEEEEEILKLVNNRLYITYYKKRKKDGNFEKIIKKNYKTIDEIFESIIKSCFVPFFVDGNILYKEKYFDGLTPYIFEINNKRKMLYLNLCDWNKLEYMINIKNEKSDYHRIITGILDVHLFLIKESNTSMCSYVNNWTLLYKIRKQYIKYIYEYLIVKIITIIIKIKESKINNLKIRDIELLKKRIKDNLFDVYKEIIKYYTI